MDAQEYRSALKVLGLSQIAAARWLGVSPKTAQNYASKGPSGPAAVAVRMALGLYGLERLDVETRGPHGGWLAEAIDPRGEYVRYSDLGSVIGIGTDITG